MGRIAIRDAVRESRLVGRRLVVAGSVVFLVGLFLLGRLAFLQIGSHQRYATLSEKNRLDFVALPPVRGLIFDRNGVMLAHNLPIYTLELVPDKVPDLDGTLARLRTLVDLTDSELGRLRRQLRQRAGFETLTVRQRVSDAEAARFAVDRMAFPGVTLRARLQRHYPLGSLAGHVVGYVGRINEGELRKIDKALYRGTDYIGKLGIEAYYESSLLGRPGYEQVETNAHGRVVRKLAREPARAGRNLHLTLDVRLQAVAEEALGEQRGAVVAVEPATGDVLVLASAPTYDVNLFVDGIDAESYARLRDSPDRPLFNRALTGLYAPGSTIKAVLGLAALEYGRRPERTTYCPGWFKLPNSSHRYRDWKKSGHGAVNLHDAIVQSCDVYFYQLAAELGIERLSQFMKRFGFGRRTGVDLPGEKPGLVPSPAWKRRTRGAPWYPGETVITGIGQGYTLVTPLQLAHAMALVATRGRGMRPRLVRGLETRGAGNIEALPPTPVRPVVLRDARYYDIVTQALTDVVHSARGTARRIGRDAPYRIAGKTGTSQVVGIGQNETYKGKNLPKRLRDHALFIAFAPVEAPRIAVAVIVENGGHGGSAAAPIARKVMDYFLLGKPGENQAPTPKEAPPPAAT